MSYLPRVLLLLASTIVAFTPAFSQTSQSSPRTPGEVLLRIIVVESLDEAQRVVEQLKNGENFVALARKVSIDATAESGGLVGLVPVSTLRPDVRIALNGLQVGQFSPVVRVATGFAVLKIVANEEAGESGSVPMVTPALAATGSVRYVFDVSGFGESTLALRQFSKPPDWNENPRTICEVRAQSSASALATLESDLFALAPRPPVPPYDLVQAHFLRGQLHAYQGTMGRTIEAFEKAYQIAVSDVPAAPTAIG